MISFLDFYPYLKIIHIIAMISFMAGILYLPRLFVYHSMQEHESDTDRLLQTMERKLLKFIINPAFIITIISGLALSIIYFQAGKNYWLHAKIFLVLLMGVYHMICCKYRKRFLKETKFKSTKFFRYFNEIPTIIMILIVCLVILKSF